MEMYHFVTSWFFEAPIEKVWKELADFESWPAWTSGFKKIKLRGSKRVPQLGSLADCEVKGDLPYTLRFTIELTAFEPPNLMEYKSSGDLAGGGKWILEPCNGGTNATEYWDVGMTNSFFDILGKLPPIRSMMEKNHNTVMDRAYQGLKRRVQG